MWYRCDVGVRSQHRVQANWLCERTICGPDPGRNARNRRNTCLLGAMDTTERNGRLQSALFTRIHAISEQDAGSLDTNICYQNAITRERVQAAPFNPQVHFPPWSYQYLSEEVRDARDAVMHRLADVIHAMVCLSHPAAICSNDVNGSESHPYSIYDKPCSLWKPAEPGVVLDARLAAADGPTEGILSSACRSPHLEPNSMQCTQSI